MLKVRKEMNHEAARSGRPLAAQSGPNDQARCSYRNVEVVSLVYRRTLDTYGFVDGCMMRG